MSLSMRKHWKFVFCRQEIEKSKQLPDQVDWRDAGVISEVKNQGSCGSCWAFATTAQIESYAAMNNVSLTKLSAQEVTTCTPNPLKCGGTGGCRGKCPHTSELQQRSSKILEEHSTKRLLEVRILYQSFTTLGLEPVSIIHYTRPGSSIKRPTPN